MAATPTLIRAWLALLALSAASTAVAALLPALGGTGLRVAVLAILALGWAKARVILLRYLGLAGAPAAARAFQAALAGFTLAAAGLYLAA